MTQEDHRSHNVAAELRASIMRLARAGDASALRAQLARPGQPGAINKKVLGTALHLAVAGNHLECCEVLLNSGADTDDTNAAGNTCMHVAAAAGNPGVMQMLMDFQASLNIRNHDGKCAIALSSGPEIRQLISAEVKRRTEAAKQRAQFSLAMKVRTGHHHQQQQRAAVPQLTPPRSEEQQRGPFCTPLGGKSPLGAARHTRADSPLLGGSPDLLICRVCLREFCSEPQTEPMCLPCGHTFCRACISHLRGTTAPGALPHSFRCPLDRQVFSRNLELKVNTLLADLIPLVQRLSSAQSRASDAGLSPTVAALDVHGLGRLPRQPALRSTRDAACSPLAVASHPESPAGAPEVDMDAEQEAQAPEKPWASPRSDRSFGGLVDLAAGEFDGMADRVKCSPEICHGA